MVCFNPPYSCPGKAILFDYLETKSHKISSLYPVRNNAPLLPPGQRPSGPAAAAGLDFRIIPAGFIPFRDKSLTGFNAPLEFLTGFTHEWNDGMVE